MLTALIHSSNSLQATQHPISFIMFLTYATPRRKPFRCQALCVQMSTNSEIPQTDIAPARWTTINETKLLFRNGCHAFRADS